MRAVKLFALLLGIGLSAASLLNAHPVLAADPDSASQSQPLSATDCAQSADRPATSTGGTQLSDVLASARQFSPLVLQAQSKLREREGQLLAAQGQFDPNISSEWGGRLSGFYSGKYAGATLNQPLTQWNGRLFAGYRVSDGSFPIYEDQRITSGLGEFRIGFALSLLRDRDIDSRRYQWQRSSLDQQIETEQLRQRQLSVQQQSYVAYARWLLAVQLEQAYEELLALAQRRQQAISRSVKAGEVAEIVLVENQQALLQRQALLLDVQRQREQAAQQLSLYLRDAQGQPRQPEWGTASQLLSDDQAWLSQDEQEMIARALQWRPDLRIAQLALEQTGLERQLARNQALPRLDLSAYSARDFGGGSDSLEGTDHIVQLKLDIPLRTRTAQGQSQAAQARGEALRYQIQWLEEQTVNDIRNALINVETTQRLSELANEELSLARQLLEAENRRFERGLSDFFLLNVRERSYAEAQLKGVQAALEHQLALAGLYGVTMNLSALGLDDLDSGRSVL